MQERIIYIKKVVKKHWPLFTLFFFLIGTLTFGSLLGFKTSPVKAGFEAQAGTLTLTPTFNSVGIELTFTGDDNANATASLEFKKQSDVGWRQGLPLNRTDDGTIKAFYGSALLLEAGTTYDVRITLADADSVTGTNPVAGSVNTRAENIPAASSLTPTHCVATNGNDLNTGLAVAGICSQATAWKTLDKAVSSAPSGAVVQVAPGYYVSSAATITQPITIKAEFPAVSYNSSTKQPELTGSPSNYTIIEPRAAGGGFSVAGPTGATDPNLAAVGPWVAEMRGALADRQVWRWSGAPVGNASSMGYSATRGGLPIKVATWTKVTPPADGSKAGTSTVDDWADVMYTMTGRGSYNYGFWSDGTDTYLRMPPKAKRADGTESTNPNDFYFLLASDAPTDGGRGLTLDTADCRVSGLYFKTVWDGVWLGRSARNCVIDNNFFTGHKSSIKMDGAGGSYGSGHVFQYNRFQGTGLYSEDQVNNPTIPWFFVKQSDRATATVGNPPTSKPLADKVGTSNQAVTINGQVWHKEVVIRYNTCAGNFDCASGDTAGGNRYSGSNVDVHDNYVSQMVDDGFDMSDWAINYRLWNNTVRKTLTFFSLARYTFGPAYIFRNSVWMFGTAGIAPDASGGNVIGVTGFKYGDSTQRPPGRVYIINNTFWSTDPSSTGGNDLAGSCTAASCPRFYLRNNIFRVTRNAWVVSGSTASWDENYNDIMTTFTNQGMKFLSNLYNDQSGGTFADYQNASGGQGANSNLRSEALKGVRKFTGLAADMADSEFTDTTAGDLTLKAGAFFIDKGTAVPNISDLAGFNYQGTAPDLGACEGTNCLAALGGAASLTPTPTTTPGPTDAPTPTVTPTGTPSPTPTPALSITSGPTSSTTVNSATITWVTGRAGSSRVDYGITDSGERSSVEIDTITRVTSHSVSLTGLFPCTTYRYKAASRDGLGNSTVSDLASFATAGCTGSSGILNETSALIAYSSPTTLSLLNAESKGIAVKPEPLFASSNMYFQIKQLEKDRVFSALATPSGYQHIGSYLYRLDAFIDPLNASTAFQNDITVTITYTDADIAGLDENTLTIKRYNQLTSSWESLQNCIVDATAKTVTCKTTTFSDFGLFGAKQYVGNVKTDTYREIITAALVAAIVAYLVTATMLGRESSKKNSKKK